MRDAVQRNEVAELTIRTRSPLAFDLYADSEVTGRFVLVDEYDVAGGGIITEAVEDAQSELREEARARDLAWASSDIGLEDRALHLGHRAALVVLVGEADATGPLARGLERRLVEDGRHAYLLDDRNLRSGLDVDVEDSDAAERVRRFGEVARLLLDTGLIVVAALNRQSEADATAIQTLVHPNPTVLVSVGAGDTEEPIDLSVGDSNVDAALDQLLAELEQRDCSRHGWPTASLPVRELLDLTGYDLSPAPPLKGRGASPDIGYQGGTRWGRSADEVG